MRSWLLLALVAATGCVVPRSMTVGQMAAPVGRGATEVGVFGGVMYATQTNPPFTTQDAAGDSVTNQSVGKAFAAPGAEANIQHGFNENFALNVHASPAGVQPGLKWTINRSRIAHVALLPAIGVGYASYGQSVYSAGVDGVQMENNPSSTTSFTFLGGLKVLVSHRSGFFAGVGYDFIFNRSLSSTILGTGSVQTRSETLTSTLAHQISASVGMDIALGLVHLRPEIAFAVYPGLSTNITTRTPPNESSVGAGGGFGFAILPGFTIAVASPPRAKTEAEEEEEEQPKKKRGGDDEDEDEADDEDEKPRSKRKAADDDEDEKPKKRRSSEDDE